MEFSAGLLFYAGFLFLTLLTAIISNFKNRLIPFAYITIIVSLLVPLLTLVFYVGNTGNEIGVSYLLQEFRARNLWAVIITFMYIYLAIWIVLFTYVLFGNSLINWYNYIFRKGKKPEKAVSERTKQSKKPE